MVLIDVRTLTIYLIDQNVGVSIANTYKSKKADLNYFSGE